MLVFCRTSCIFCVRRLRYSTSVTGLLASTFSTRAKTVFARLLKSCSSAAPSSVRIAENLDSACETTERISCVACCSSSSCFSTTKISEKRVRLETEMSSFTS